MRPLPCLMVWTCLATTRLVQAQDIQLGGVITLWYVQILDESLRLQVPAGSALAGTVGAPYYPLHQALRENGFVVRRAEIYLSGRVSSTWSWNIAMDPNGSSGILADCTATWVPTPQFSLRVGQFKPLQGYEGTIVTAPNLLFFDRSMLARQFGDRWDRGLVGTWTLAKPGLDARFSVGVFNGNARADARNAQRDWVARVDVESSTGHRAGVYGLTGHSDLPDNGSTVAAVLPGQGAPSAETVRAAFDHTSNYGAYYAFDRRAWHAEVEVMGGRLGRRYPTLSMTPGSPSLRQHLDQRYLGYVLTAAYHRGSQAITARWDVMNYNAGNDWYGSNPYLTSRGNECPRFTERILGWNWSLAGDRRWRTVHLKLNYIHRTGPVLLPVPGGSTAMAGDNLVFVVQCGF